MGLEDRAREEYEREVEKERADTAARDAVEYETLCREMGAAIYEWAGANEVTVRNVRYGRFSPSRPPRVELGQNVPSHASLQATFECEDFTLHGSFMRYGGLSVHIDGSLRRIEKLSDLLAAQEDAERNRAKWRDESRHELKRRRWRLVGYAGLGVLFLYLVACISASILSRH